MTPVATPHPLQEDVSFGELADGREGVLHDAHDGPVGLRRDDHTRHHRQLLNLRPRLEGLGQVEVHLVAVKVGVVWSGDTGGGGAGGR